MFKGSATYLHYQSKKHKRRLIMSVTVPVEDQWKLNPSARVKMIVSTVFNFITLLTAIFLSCLPYNTFVKVNDIGIGPLFVEALCEIYASATKSFNINSKMNTAEMYSILETHWTPAWTMMACVYGIQIALNILLCIFPVKKQVCRKGMVVWYLASAAVLAVAWWTLLGWIPNMKWRIAAVVIGLLAALIHAAIPVLCFCNDGSSALNTSFIPYSKGRVAFVPRLIQPMPAITVQSQQSSQSSVWVGENKA